MVLLALIGLVWLSCCVMAVALCVAARRADDRVAAAHFQEPIVVVEPVVVDFVATFAEPQAQPAPAPAPHAVRAAQRQSV
jgi:hypothetical protein